MRVIAGRAKSMPLKTVSGNGTRPTTDRVKETLFNMIQPQLSDCNFLDLFSGSGGIGIEALSRGARHCVFVEKDRGAASCIRENLSFTKLVSFGKIINSDVLSALKQLEGRECFDLIFMDPPYDMEWEKKVLEYLTSSSLITLDTLLIVEASNKTSFSYLEDLNYEIVKKKEYKTNVHMFIKRKEK